MIRKTWRSFSMIINYKTFIVTVLALINTEICHIYEITADFPLTLVSVAIVFPIVFSINSAYNRREQALQHFATIKGHGAALVFASKHWFKIENNTFPPKMIELMRELLLNMKELFLTDYTHDIQHEQNVYRAFHKVSILINELRAHGASTSEISRLNQYISKMIIAFDGMKIVYHYRTPITLRAYSSVFIYSFPILFGPYFASTFSHYSEGLAYVMPILYCFILVSLANIQDHLEDPYDQIGEDDIHINENEYIDLLRLESEVL